MKLPDNDDDNRLAGGDFDPEAPAQLPAIGRRKSIKATLESEKYDAATIRQEFCWYQALLPKPDKVRRFFGGRGGVLPRR